MHRSGRKTNDPRQKYFGYQKWPDEEDPGTLKSLKTNPIYPIKEFKNNHDLVTFVTMIEIHCDEKWRPCQVTCVKKFKSVLKYMYVCLRWLIRIFGK